MDGGVCGCGMRGCGDNAGPDAGTARTGWQRSGRTAARTHRGGGAVYADGGVPRGGAGRADVDGQPSGGMEEGAWGGVMMKGGDYSKNGIYVI